MSNEKYLYFIILDKVKTLDISVQRDHIQSLATHLSAREFSSSLVVIFTDDIDPFLQIGNIGTIDFNMFSL